MNIGKRIKDLRITQDLTQEELADRSELTKGFISQIERDLTSPSVDSLLDILEALGTDPETFFARDENEKIVFKKEDYFESDNDDLGYVLEWIVPNAQKNLMEPTLVTIAPKGKTKNIPPYDGEEFGYVIKGSVKLVYGNEEIYDLKKGETFYFRAEKEHYLLNEKNSEARVLWISSPPSF